MSKILDVKREVGLLSTGAKKTWQTTLDLINKMAEVQNWTSSQKQSLIQRKLAAIRYADLKSDNEYNKKSSDELASKKIKANEKEMERLDSIYKSLATDVQEVEAILDENISKIANQKKNNLSK